VADKKLHKYKYQTTIRRRGFRENLENSKTWWDPWRDKKTKKTRIV